MTIRLTTKQIDLALPKVGQGLSQYLWLQGQLKSGRHVWNEREFRRRFNHFYRVRRGSAWQHNYFHIMGEAARAQLDFHAVLDLLRAATGRYEASFASKLIASLDPSQPVIDAIVLKNLGLRLPGAGAHDRLGQIAKLHTTMAGMFARFLASENGAYLVERFGGMYPEADISDQKKVDFVLWQTRQ